MSTSGGLPIGLRLISTSVQDAVDTVRRADADGFPWVSFPHSFGPDALTLCAVAGASVKNGNGIQLATFVMPTYPRHPVVMAQQAIAAHDASGGRLMLGIGLSHQIVIEGMLGLKQETPALHMREYLSVLLPLL